MIEPLYGGGLPHAMKAGVVAAKIATAAVAANDFSDEFLAKYATAIDETLGGGYKIQEYLRKTVFGTMADISELIDYSIENFTGVKLSGGDGMAKFVIEKRGFKGDTKSSYSK